MTNYFIFIFVLLSVHSADGQNQILDAELKQPVSFAHIKSTHQLKGIIADFDGRFVLDSSFRKSDSITISCIGYTKATFLVADIVEKKVIELAPIENNLSEVSVSVKKISYAVRNLGVTKKPNRTSFPSYAGTAKNGEEKALWIPNDHSIPGYLKNINIFVSDLGYPDAYFRIHVYACHAFETKPAEELTTSNIITAATIGNEWIRVDVSSERIQIGENGCFIGIEWFDSPKSTFHADTIFNKGYTWDGDEKKDTVFSRIRTGNGVVIGSINQKYRISKNKHWYKTPEGWKSNNFSESIMYTTDTLPDGSTYYRTPDNHYQAVLCINIDVAYPKNKIDPIYEQPKNSALNHLEKVKVNQFIYPQTSIHELFSSLIKAFETDDIIYVLKYLCVYKDDQLHKILNEINDEENDNYITDEEKVKIVTKLKELQSKLDTAVLTKIDEKHFELSIMQETYNLIIDDGLWKINPYSYRIVK